MKNTLISIIVFGSILGQFHAQKSEFQVNYRFGYPTNNLKMVSAYSGNNINEYKNMKVKSLYDNGLTFNYKYLIWERIKLFANCGFEISQSKHYQPLIDPSGRLLENIELSDNRIGFYLGLSKQIHLYDSRLILDLGIQFVDRYPFEKRIDYKTDYHYGVQNWIEYKYELNTYFGEFYPNDGTIENIPSFYLNLDYNANLKFKLRDNIFINLGFNYSRNNHFFYDFKYSILYYYNGSSTPDDTFEFYGLSGSNNPKFPIKNHYLYLNTGITFKF